MRSALRSGRLWIAALLAVGLSVTSAPAATAAPPGGGDPARLIGLDPERATVLDFQRAIGQHRLSSTALTAYYLHRIRTVDPKLHAVIETNSDAIRDAAASDAHRRRRGARSALEGIPVLLKDNIDTRDRLHTTAGSLALLGARPARDAFLVKQLRDAGAVVLGKANLSEWANFRSTSSSSGWSARGGQTNNPYVLDRNPCGSSSGSAVAAAAGLAAVTIGTETDGSIVCPAGATGVVGVKPTLGLVSRAGIIPISAEQDTAGPITRNVTDAAAVLSVIQGVDGRDPATRVAGPYVRRDYLRSLDRGALRGKRIGVWRAAAENDPVVTPVLDASIAELRSLGATVVDNVALEGLDQANANEFPALLVEFKHDLNAYLSATPGSHPKDLAGLIAFNNANAGTELRHFGQEIFELAQATDGDIKDPAYLKLRETATRAARAAIDNAVAANRLDAILAPSNGPAWVTNPSGDVIDNFIGSSGPAAISGYPNVTVPAGYARGVLPLGVSFFGSRWSEPTLVSLAYAFEQATRVRKPPTYLPTLG